MIGNFIADSIRGSAFNNYEHGIKNGILLHRFIDSYTDAHPVYLQSVNRLRPRYKKYAGVIMDIFYDYFLAINWQQYSPIPLAEYTVQVHRTLLQHKNKMPTHSQLFLQYMVKYNVPMVYATHSGIAQVLKGMAHRARFKSDMEHATTELKLYQPEMQIEFTLFFADMIKAANGFIERKKIGG